MDRSPGGRKLFQIWWKHKKGEARGKGNSGEARVTVRIQIISKSAREILSRDAAWAAVCGTLNIEAILWKL